MDVLIIIKVLDIRDYRLHCYLKIYSHVILLIGSKLFVHLKKKIKLVCSRVVSIVPSILKSKFCFSSPYCFIVLSLLITFFLKCWRWWSCPCQEGRRRTHQAYDPLNRAGRYHRQGEGREAVKVIKSFTPLWGRGQSSVLHGNTTKQSISGFFKRN